MMTASATQSSEHMRCRGHWHHHLVILVTLLFSVTSAGEVCVVGQRCNASKITGLALLQREALLKKKMEVDGDVDEAAILNLLEFGVASGQPLAASILQTVKHMAEKDAKGQQPAGNITEEVLEKIIKAMEENVIEAGKVSHNEDQTEVNRDHTSIITCNKTREEHFTKPGSGVNFLEGRMKEEYKNLTKCKTEQASLKDTQVTECTAFTTFVKGLQNSKPSCVCNLPTTPSDTVLTCIQQAASWGKSNSATYIELRDNCNTSTANHDSKKKTCDANQGSFESAFCSYGLLLTTTCQEYDTCHANALAKYNETKTNVKVAENSRKQEFVAAKKVICYVGVVRAKDADKTKLLEKCKAENYDTTQLDIVYPAVPDRATCDTSPVDAKPCDDTFISKYYSNFDPLAPPEACIPCAWG